MWRLALIMIAIVLIGAVVTALFGTGTSAREDDPDTVPGAINFNDSPCMRLMRSAASGANNEIQASLGHDVVPQILLSHAEVSTFRCDGAPSRDEIRSIRVDFRNSDGRVIATWVLVNDDRHRSAALARVQAEQSDPVTDTREFDRSAVALYPDTPQLVREALTDRAAIEATLEPLWPHLASSLAEGWERIEDAGAGAAERD